MSDKPVNAIPSTVTIVNMKTGGKETKPMNWGLMPPAPDKCQFCATKHEEHSAHNQQSLYYRIAFHSVNKRLPTWADAVAHCSDERKALWQQALEKENAWSEPENGPPIKHHGLDPNPKIKGEA